jgi:hypothetical protein
MCHLSNDDAPCWIEHLGLLDPDFDDWGDLRPPTPWRELPWGTGRPPLP